MEHPEHKPNEGAPRSEERRNAPAGEPSREGGSGENKPHRRNRHRNRHHSKEKRDPAVTPAETGAESREYAPRPSAPQGGAEGEKAPRTEGEHRSRTPRRGRRRGRTEKAETPASDELLLTPSEEIPEPSYTEVSLTTSEPLPDEELEEERFPELKEEAPQAPEPEFPRYTVAGIRFRPGGKIYYFDPEDMACEENQHVIVETARGIEFGIVALANRQVSARDVVLPLRKVVRFATPEDERRHEDNLEKETEAFNLCLTRIEAHRLDMKLVDVEYAFDNSKLLFYFTSENRVDFRELCKDLASIFRTRIELRQIGIRDEAKLMGGLGVCGRPFCCKSFLPDFVQVSIKMAKEQNLSLNSAKISGACGRLMCCLRYEYDTYVAESAITPKVDDLVDTPDGDGIVTESSPLKGTVKVSLTKDPSSLHLYRREDVKVTGHMKKKKGGHSEEKK